MSHPPRPLSDEALLTEIYSSFEPFKPPVKAAYVGGLMCDRIHSSKPSRDITNSPRSADPLRLIMSGHDGVTY